MISKINTEIANVTKGDYKYVASKYFNTSNDAYGVIFAKSMKIEPMMLVNNKTYDFPAAMKFLYTVKLTEEKQIIANATITAHAKIYNENLNFFSDLYMGKPVVLNAGTYYVLVANGSCNTNNQISITIF